MRFEVHWLDCASVAFILLCWLFGAKKKKKKKELCLFGIYFIGIWDYSVLSAVLWLDHHRSFWIEGFLFPLRIR